MKQSSLIINFTAKFPNQMKQRFKNDKPTHEYKGKDLEPFSL